jgi:hypothetical protein
MHMNLKQGDVNMKTHKDARLHNGAVMGRLVIYLFCKKYFHMEYCRRIHYGDSCCSD